MTLRAFSDAERDLVWSFDPLSLAGLRGRFPALYDALLARVLEQAPDSGYRALVADLLRGWFAADLARARPLAARLSAELVSLRRGLDLLNTDERTS